MPAKTFRGFWKRWRGSVNSSNLTGETRFTLQIGGIASPVASLASPPSIRCPKMPTAVSPSGSGQPPADGVAHEGGGLMDVQLPHQVAPMRLDGFDAQVQVRRYLLRRLPLRDALDDLAFARGRAGPALPQDACGGEVEP